MGVLIAVVVVFSRFLRMKQRFKNQFHVYSRIIDWNDFRTFWAGIGTAVADVVGMLLFPKAGYFPGFTLNAFLAGAIYGYFYYKKEMTWQRVILATLLVTVLINIILTPLWLSLMYGVNLANFAWWVPRLIKTVIFFPIQVIATYYLGNKIPFKRLFGKPLSELDQ